MPSVPLSPNLPSSRQQGALLLKTPDSALRPVAALTPPRLHSCPPCPGAVKVVFVVPCVWGVACVCEDEGRGRGQA